MIEATPSRETAHARKHRRQDRYPHSGRRPQRSGLCGVSRCGGYVGTRAGAATCRRRRGRHRGVPSGVPQFGGELHREPAQSESDPRSPSAGTRAAGGGAAVFEFPAAARWAIVPARRRARRGRHRALVEARCGAAAEVLRDARSRGRGAARIDAARAAERVGPLRAGRLAGLVFGRETAEDFGHGRAPRSAGSVREIRGRSAGQLV